jgi:hypothetical protein
MCHIAKNCFIFYTKRKPQPKPGFQYFQKADLQSFDHHGRRSAATVTNGRCTNGTAVLFQH